MSLLFAACSADGTALPDGGGGGGGADFAPPINDDGGGGGGPDGASGNDDLAPASTVTTIHIHYPAGTHAMALRGDAAPLSWTQGVPLTAAADGSFTYVFPDLPAGKPAAFKPLLDDTTWSHGPNYLVSRGATIDVYPHFTATHGTVKQLFPTFHSTTLNNDRTVYAYLPPSYDENPLARYPVLYMHDGQNLFDPSLAFGGNEWKVDETLDAAIEGDGMSAPPVREIIVVGPANTAQRIYEYTPTTDPTTPGGGGGDLYLKMLIEELKPQVDAMLRTLPERGTTGIMGSSLGGLISAYAGVKHPDVYGIVGAMSPSTWWNSTVLLTDVGMMKGAALKPDLVYVDCGDPGDDSTDTMMLVADYLDVGYVEPGNLLHVYQPGGMHNEIYWAQRLPAALAFLFPPK
jgi:predicted alpha/beta superfamily hydrolase